MKDREERIAHTMNYCQHYRPQGAKIVCGAGCDIDNIKRVQTRPEKAVWLAQNTLGSTT